VVAQPPHEVARRRGKAALMVPDEDGDVAVRRVGLPVRYRRNDLRRGAPSTFGASCPPLTSSCRANGVTVERGQDVGSSTTIG
jgi:hypothetical protein